MAIVIIFCMLLVILFIGDKYTYFLRIMLYPCSEINYFLYFCKIKRGRSVWSLEFGVWSGHPTPDPSPPAGRGGANHIYRGER